MGHVWLVHCGWYAPMGHVWLVHCGWYAPLATLPKGREFLRAVFEVVLWRSFPLGKVGMELLCWLVRTLDNSCCIATPYYIYTLHQEGGVGGAL